MNSAAVRLDSVAPGSIPWLNPIDLIVSKIDACGQRPSAAKRERDVRDAETLLDAFTRNGNLRLSSEQKQIVMQGLEDVLRESLRDRTWWETKPGLRKSPSPE